jgi:hypothetical protein
MTGEPMLARWSPRAVIARFDPRSLACCAAGWLGCEPGAVLAIEALLQRSLPLLRAAVRRRVRRAMPKRGDT